MNWLQQMDAHVGISPNLSSERLERRYALIKVAKGDWLLPSNDKSALFRLRSYMEDGSLINVLPDGTEIPVVGNFWSIHRYRGTTEDAWQHLDADDKWAEVEYGLVSRDEAIQTALRRSATKREP